MSSAISSISSACPCSSYGLPRFVRACSIVFPRARACPRTVPNAFLQGKTIAPRAGNTSRLVQCAKVLKMHEMATFLNDFKRPLGSGTRFGHQLSADTSRCGIVKRQAANVHQHPGIVSRQFEHRISVRPVTCGLAMQSQVWDDDADDMQVPPFGLWPCARAEAMFVPDRAALTRYRSRLVPFPRIIIHRGLAHVEILLADVARTADGQCLASTVMCIMSVGRHITCCTWAAFSHEEGWREARAALVSQTDGPCADDTHVAEGDCWPDQRVLALLPAGRPILRRALMFTYMGAPGSHEPPNTYRLVFKHMPLHIAACLVAVGAYLMGIEMRPSMVYCRDMSLSRGGAMEAELDFLRLAQLKRMAL